MKESNKSNSNLVFAALFATSDAAAADSISMEIKLTIFIALLRSPSFPPSLGAATVVTMGSNVDRVLKENSDHERKQRISFKKSPCVMKHYLLGTFSPVC